MRIGELLDLFEAVFTLLALVLVDRHGPMKVATDTSIFDSRDCMFWRQFTSWMQPAAAMLDSRR